MFQNYVHYFLISGALMNAATLTPPGNVYTHGTYWSGQWTGRPDRDVLVMGGGTAGRRRQESIVDSCSIYCSWIFDVSWFQTIQWYYLLLAVDINSEGFGSMFDDLVRTVVWSLQSLLYCILSYKDVGAMREITVHERSLSHVMMDWGSLQLCLRFLQPSYVSNLIHGVAAAAMEELGRKVQGSAVHRFCCTAMKIILECRAYV